MRIIGLILATAMVIACACAICYAIYSCFGLMASVVYMTVVVIGLAWTIYEMKHASMSDE
ncbi:hypothetical protein [Bacteroides sp. 519]|uniref:hypothetical protein n=1 Tax=Bacteroides sp. 519 TaxID=2302937 RepID=UPI0013D66819|nr:hypothetical protein [Bacteroides sp. 519]NDV57017.1 hypothetical protein [Bacteroides sp. 519]